MANNQYRYSTTEDVCEIREELVSESKQLLIQGKIISYFQKALFKQIEKNFIEKAIKEHGEAFLKTEEFAQKKDVFMATKAQKQISFLTQKMQNSFLNSMPVLVASNIQAYNLLKLLESDESVKEELYNMLTSFSSSRADELKKLKEESKHEALLIELISDVQKYIELGTIQTWPSHSKKIRENPKAVEIINKLVEAFSQHSKPITDELVSDASMRQFKNSNINHLLNNGYYKEAFELILKTELGKNFPGGITKYDELCTAIINSNGMCVPSSAHQKTFVLFKIGSSFSLSTLIHEYCHAATANISGGVNNKGFCGFNTGTAITEIDNKLFGKFQMMNETINEFLTQKILGTFYPEETKQFDLPKNHSNFYSDSVMLFEDFLTNFENEFIYMLCSTPNEMQNLLKNENLNKLAELINTFTKLRISYDIKDSLSFTDLFKHIKDPKIETLMDLRKNASKLLSLCPEYADILKHLEKINSFCEEMKNNKTFFKNTNLESSFQQ